MSAQYDFDYLVIGSGFGGSASALRLSEKGYKVLVLEQGKWLREEDFPTTNWQLKKWLWLPALRFFGLFRITFFRYATVVSGAGVGGGSLVYANTLPMPTTAFFQADPWAHLADWQAELQDCYATAARMLGSNRNPRLEVGDLTLLEIARDLGKEDQFAPTDVAVFFGEPGVTVPDPYFGGRGPDRAGCTFCGGCMLGCRFNAKNTLVKNYLHLAQLNGAVIQAESQVYDVQPLGAADGGDGYLVRWKSSTALLKKPRGEYTCRGVVFAGGVLGTVPLLLDIKKRSLPRLSDQLGRGVRTNSEALIGVTALDDETVFSDGIAIGSILHTDEHSHLEPVRYSPGAGFWRLLMSPMVGGHSLLARLANVVREVVRHPREQFKIFTVRDWSRSTQILLFMQTINTRLRLSGGPLGMRSAIDRGDPPTAFMPEAMDLANRFAAKVNGKPVVLVSETLVGMPTTAHILGGCVMGSDASKGVIDRDNRVFGYQNMLICDGSAISANPGVNPALTITAITERAMSKIPPRYATKFTD